MFLVLLVEIVAGSQPTSPIPSWIYLPIWGTLGAALIAAGVAIRNNVIATHLARELKDRDYNLARELKDKDYKNEFYKKIIDKRLEAWSSAQAIINLLSIYKRDVNSKVQVPAYFISKEKFDELINLISSSAATRYWLGLEYANAVADMGNWLAGIANSCMDKQESTHTIKVFDTPEEALQHGVNLKSSGPPEARLNEGLLWQAGIANHKEATRYLHTIINSVGKEIAKMHEVEPFLKMISGIGIKQD